MEIEIKQADIKKALQVLESLPEFDRMFEAEYYNARIIERDHLILVAFLNQMPVGCKVGYDRYKDGSFYSWLGGVTPEHRSKGVAKALANFQEEWIKQKGFKSIKFKTLNRHKSMLQFAIQNGFEIYNVKEKDELENYRIEMIKFL